jgi:hypothetical protein
MMRKTNLIGIIIYLLQHLTKTYLPFLQLVILIHWKLVICKDYPHQITDFKHYSFTMSISQSLIRGIIVTDCLLDLLMNSMQVICYVSSLDAQVSNVRNEN